MTGFTGELPPARFNLTRYCLAQSARDQADKTALTIADGTSYQTLSFAEIEDTILRLASAFRLLGFDRGARILIRMGNSFDYAAVFFAANAAELVPIPASSMLSADEISFILSDSQAAAIVHDGMLDMPDLPVGCRLITPADIAAFKSGPRGQYADTAATTPAYMVYTSGTSGRPKGVLHAQRAAWGRRPMYQGWYGINSEDTILHTGAFNWTYTLGTALFDPWANGASSIVYTGPRDRCHLAQTDRRPQPHHHGVRSGAVSPDAERWRTVTSRNGHAASWPDGRRGHVPRPAERMAGDHRHRALRSIGHERNLHLHFQFTERADEARQPRKTAARPQRLHSAGFRR